jgi:hypothetical protein
MATIETASLSLSEPASSLPNQASGGRLGTSLDAGSRITLAFKSGDPSLKLGDPSRIGRIRRPVVPLAQQHDLSVCEAYRVAAWIAGLGAPGAFAPTPCGLGRRLACRIAGRDVGFGPGIGSVEYAVLDHAGSPTIPGRLGAFGDTLSQTFRKKRYLVLTSLSRM